VDRPAPVRPYNSLVHPRGWRSFMEYGSGTIGDKRVIQRGKGNCHAYHYLGWIELKKGGSTADSHFLSSCSC